MTAVFELGSFERRVASGETVLLRVTGRWRAQTDLRLPDPILRVGDQLLRSLPGPTPLRAGPDAPRWTATYSAPASLHERSFALEVGPQLVALPAPVTSDDVPADIAPPDAGALQERAAEVAAMAREALREVAPLRERVETLERALRERDEEVEDLRGRLLEAERAQSRETSARRAAEEEVDALTHKLDEAEAAREHLRTTAYEADVAAREVAVRLDRLRTEDAAASRDELDGLRAELAALRSERDHHRDGETALRNELTVTIVERDRLREEAEASAAQHDQHATVHDRLAAVEAERDTLREQLATSRARRKVLRTVVLTLVVVALALVVLQLTDMI